MRQTWRWFGPVDKVTIADARRAAKRLYDPDKLTVVVVGNPANLASTN